MEITQSTETNTILERRFTLKELMTLTKLSKASIYRHIEQGKLAQPEKWGRSSRWKESDVMEWCSYFSRGLDKSINPNAHA